MKDVRKVSLDNIRQIKEIVDFLLESIPEEKLANTTKRFLRDSVARLLGDFDNLPKLPKSDHF